MQRRYVFAGSEPGSSTVIVERRRTPRRQFVDPVQVTLRGIGGRDPIPAALLNAGPGGLACRVSHEALRSTPIVGRVARVDLTIDADESLALYARVINATAGSPGHVVLGMEFLPEEKAAPHGARFRAVLRQAGNGREVRVP